MMTARVQDAWEAAYKRLEDKAQRYAGSDDGLYYATIEAALLKVIWDLCANNCDEPGMIEIFEQIEPFKLEPEE